VERIVNLPVDRIVEKIVEKPVEVIKEVEVVKEVIVPQRVIEADKESVQKIVTLVKENNGLKEQIKKLESAKPVETVVEVEKIVEKIVEVDREVPVEVERASTKDLREAARLMARSELNKEDLAEEEIFSLLQKASEADVKKRLGFWAVPLPKSGDQTDTTNKRYIGKK
jgi:hypothetical protein